MVKFVDAETGEEIEREMTVDEFKDHQAFQKAYKDKLAAIEAQEIAKSALLERLGLTAEDAALLLK